MKIISGGQTGVDRAALDAAMSMSFPCGGWCPKGRKAEDGVIPDKYPLIELEKGGYRQRTLRNVKESDATLIIYFGELTGGTALTVEFCIKNKKPFKLIDGDEFGVDRSAEIIELFVKKYHVNTLNVAGPRAGGGDRIYSYAYEVLNKTFYEDA